MSIQIFLIDDDPIAQLIHGVLIAKACPQADRCHYEDAHAALKALKGGTSWPEFIFLDLNMPVMDGWAFLDAYQALRHPKKLFTSINILSSSVIKAEIQRAQNHPLVQGYITKPLRKHDIDAVLGLDGNDDTDEFPLAS